MNRDHETQQLAPEPEKSSAGAAAAEFMRLTGQELPVEVRLLDTFSEAGELALELASPSNSPEGLTEDVYQRVLDELGDVVFCVCALGDPRAFPIPASANSSTNSENPPGGSMGVAASIDVEAARNEFLGLVAALGDVSKAYLRGSTYGRKSFPRDDAPYAARLSRLVARVHALCTMFSCDAEILLRRALDKYERRHARGGTSGSENEWPASTPLEIAGGGAVSRARSAPSRRRPAGLPEFEVFAARLATAAGAIVRKHFRARPAVREKADLTLVSVADLEAEKLMREMIGDAFPDHGILGEEFGCSLGSARYQWVLDPIDGTKSFLDGAFDFGTLVALLDDGLPILGVIHLPLLGDTVIGDGTATTFNGRLSQVRECKALSGATLLATDLLNVGYFQDDRGFRELTGKVQRCRTWGNCYGYAMLASGFADIMIDPIMSPWDIMALIPIIRGAGGEITDYFGGNPIKGTSIVAANHQIHREVIACLGSTLINGSENRTPLP